LKSKLAIIGCATETRDNVDYNDPDLDIWVFNESCTKAWCKRADAVIQMHQETIWKNPMNRGDAKHGEWLMSGETPPIYMLEQYPEVPKSIKFPKDEIVAKLLPNLTVDSERGRKDFFTSTIAYAQALGIYLGYKEIHTYGIELADEDEYREQQPCAMFWVGVGVGLGVKWVSHSKMFDAPLYPLETFVGLDKKVFSDKMLELEPLILKARDDYAVAKTNTETAIKRFEDSGGGKDEMLQAIWKQAEVGQQFGIFDGAKQENERYFERATAMEKMTSTYVFSKHEFNRDQSAIGVRREGEIVELNNAAGECQKTINRIEPKKFDSYRRRLFQTLKEQVDLYIRRAVVVGMYTGAINEDERFMKLMDEAKRAQK
jgi:hypothetical protein